jgi:hypothetical protein
MADNNAPKPTPTPQQPTSILSPTPRPDSGSIAHLLHYRPKK